MKQEDKELLLKDLCVRLLYRPKCHFKYDTSEDDIILKCIDGNIARFDYGWYGKFHVIIDPQYIKPYLRPLSSITEEEVMEWAKMKYGENSKEVKNFVSWKIFRYDTYCTVDIKFFVETEYGQQGYSTIFRIGSDDCESIEFFDWLNAHHFDYRGLIRKKLALPADNMIYSNKNKNDE